MLSTRRSFSRIVFLVVVSRAMYVLNAKEDKDHYSEGVHHESYDHDAFVGKDEAAEYQNLTPEQSKERLGKLLPKIDKNGDGLITEDELMEHIKFMQKRYIMKDVDRTWVNHGGNKTDDGKLKWAEYRKSVYGAGEDKDLSKDYVQMLERDQRRWKAADLDNDNALTKKEYACFTHPEDCDHMKYIVVLETVEDIDKDKDGAVDLKEYIDDMYRPSDHSEQKGEPDWVQAEREMFKTHRDKNKDGKLDKEELTEWIMPTGFDHVEAETKHLINLADDNKDGALSIEEILAHHDAFVGSQATDYGDQLQKHDPSEL